MPKQTLRSLLDKAQRLTTELQQLSKTEPHFLDPEDIARELKDISGFIDNLKELPLNERQFAIRLAERMNRNGVDELSFGFLKTSLVSLFQSAQLFCRPRGLVLLVVDDVVMLSADDKEIGLGSPLFIGHRLEISGSA